MVIVHRRKACRCPTGGRDAPTEDIEFSIEYLSKEKEFRITLPEYMHERLGKTHACGSTADDCEEDMHKLWNKFQDTFTEPREIRKLIAYTYGNNCSSYTILGDKGISILFSWDIVHVCQLNTDPPEEKGWVECTEKGKIWSTDKIRNRIVFDGSCARFSGKCYMSWTPEREEFFIKMIGQFNEIKRMMTDFFCRNKLETIISEIDMSGIAQLRFSSAQLEGDDDGKNTG